MNSLSGILLVFLLLYNNVLFLEKKEAQGRQQPLRMSLTKEDNGANLSELKLKLEIKNVGRDEVRLDGRVLTPVVLTIVTNWQGKQVPKIPPSVPKPLDIADIVTLKPNDTFSMSYRLSEVTMNESKEGPYFVWCCYATHPSPEEARMKIADVKVCSNPIQISQ